MKRFIYILTIATIIASSCVDRIEIEVPSDSDELVMNSLISPDHPIEASVALSHSLNSDQQISFPEEAEIELMGTGLQGSNLRFSYKSSTSKYILRNQQFRPKEGGEYQLRAFVPGSDVDTIFSTTQIPNKIRVADASFSNREIQIVNDAHDYFFDLKIELDEPEVFPAWLHIIPTYKINTSNEKFKFQVLDVLDNTNAVSIFYLEEGVFIDMTKLSGTEFTIRVSTLIPVKPGALIKNLYFESKSTTKDYYLYHKTRARQLEVSDAAYSSPITDFTNINNGLGVFAGYTTSTQSIKF